MLEPCQEYMRLVKEHSAAASDLFAASSLLTCVAGAGNSKAFLKAEDRCRQLIQRCAELTERLQAHVEEHGCQQKIVAH
jgi:hypothetical protein